ncbi:hypothetical protein MK280_18155, partial [Myxococcota bacterium]|nr:hypothetical protein [Myxococcota bacterium]
MTRSDSTPDRRSRPPLIFYAVTLFMAPLLFLGGLELILRVVGFGGSYPLFRDFEGLPGFRVASDQVMNRYVYGGDQPLAYIDPFLFSAKKSPGTTRIVVQGGSSAAGFPYGRWAGLAGMLDARLEARAPAEPVEVISTAMAAVNSYTLLDLADEIIEIEPDAVLIYAGHNEYLGVMGVGSAFGAIQPGWIARTRLALGRFRVYQLIDRLLAVLRAGSAAGSPDERVTVFQQAASGSRISIESDSYGHGLNQFRGNLGALLERYQRAGIPVLIGTLVSNEVDLPPFDGGPGPGIDLEKWADLEALRQRDRARGAAAEERAQIEAMLELDEQAADAWFALGGWEERAGHWAAAREAYRQARDLDRLRFRAPSAFNQTIRDLAERYGARLVEVREKFAAESEQGLIGDALLLEHVHPTARGYWILAEAFLAGLQEEHIISRPAAGLQKRLHWEEQVPLTELDRLLAMHRIREMRSSYPFVEETSLRSPPTPETEVERWALRHHRGEVSWVETMEALLQIYLAERRVEDAARVARLTAHEYPLDLGPNLVAGQLLLRLGEWDWARLYLERAQRASPEDPRPNQ